MKNLVLASMAVYGLAGCALLAPDDTASSTKAGKSAMYQHGTMMARAESDKHLQLQDYVRQIVDDMATNMRNVDNDATIAVTSFVRADSSLDETSPLSFDLAEAFMSELHRFGLTALDFKVANFIRVTPDGDFAMTRDYLELRETVDADYALVGTYYVQQGSIRVNARLVDLSSRAVLATGETSLPSMFMHYLTMQSPRIQTQTDRG